MKLEAIAYVKIYPQYNRNREIVGAKIYELTQKPVPGAIKLSISVPESYFANSNPVIQVELNEKEPEVWHGRQLPKNSA